MAMKFFALLAFWGFCQAVNGASVMQEPGVGPTEEWLNYIAGRTTSEFTRFASFLDKSARCTEKCLATTVSQIVREIYAPLQGHPEQWVEEVIERVKGPACQAYQNGKGCWDACPDGEMKMLTQAVAKVASAICNTDSLEALKQNLPCIKENINSVADSCRERCPVDAMNHLYTDIINGTPRDFAWYEKSVGAFCGYGDCASCYHDGLISHGCDQNTVDFAFKDVVRVYLISVTELLMEAGIPYEQIPAGCQQFLPQ